MDGVQVLLVIRGGGRGLVGEVVSGGEGEVGRIILRDWRDWRDLKDDEVLESIDECAGS